MSDLRIGGARGPIDPNADLDEGGAQAAAAPATPEAPVVRGGGIRRVPLPQEKWAEYNLYQRFTGIPSAAGDAAIARAEYFLNTGLLDPKVSRADAVAVLDTLEKLDPADFSAAIRHLGYTFQDGRMLLQKLFEEVFAKDGALFDRFMDQVVDKLGREFNGPVNSGTVTDEMYRTYMMEYATGETIRKRAESESRPVTIRDVKEALSEWRSPYFALGVMSLPFHLAAKVDMAVRKVLRNPPD